MDTLTAPVIALYNREITNSENLFKTMENESVGKIILAVQKIIEGTTFSFDVQKIHSTGSMCE